MLTFRSRIRLPLLASALLSIVVGACSDATAPVEARRRSGYITAATDNAAAAVLKDGNIDIQAMYPWAVNVIPTLTTRGDTTIEKFSVRPNEGRIVRFGNGSGHTIAIPANVLCDPRTPYGPTEWLKPCYLATRTVDFTVKTWTASNGRTHVDFSPDVRFSPYTPVPVRIFFAETSLVDFDHVIIPYCGPSGACVDEGQNDWLQTTFATPHPAGGYWVYRALRHFSGYNVTAF